MIITKLLQISSLYYKNPTFTTTTKLLLSHTIMSTTTNNHNTTNKKLIVIMGPTGSGKSKLSIDLITKHFPNSEIINSDKIQIYNGLPITTNKIPYPDRKKIPHHLLNTFTPSPYHPVFTASDYRLSASLTISQIHKNRKLPFLVGGSNSFIHSLISNNDYQCCFIWVDVSLPILNKYLSKRVDEMLDNGMFEELGEYFDSQESSRVPQCGLKQAIGVPEFEKYFEMYCDDWRIGEKDEEKRRFYEEAVRSVKANTCELANRQLGKILRMRDGLGWDIKRVDATEVFRAVVEGRRTAEMWERMVVIPSMKIVKEFLDG